MTEQPTCTFRGRNVDGTWHETDGLSAEQAAMLGKGQAIGFVPANERIVVGDDGTITYRARSWVDQIASPATLPTVPCVASVRDVLSEAAVRGQPRVR